MGKDEMGRWGWRLFEGDQDIEYAIELSKDDELELSQMVHQSDMLCPPNIRAWYKSPEYIPVLKATIKENRAKLDAGLGQEMMETYRRRENEPHGIYTSGYKVIMLGALMMRAGAKISQEHIDHLRELVKDVSSSPVFRVAKDDHGFREPGKMQFLAALDNYKEGVPRSFAEPSCFTCGKIKDDNGGKALCMCGTCKKAWYCDTSCQAANWKSHKINCTRKHTVNGMIAMNV